MKVALLADDPGTRAVMVALLERLQVDTDALRVPASARRDAEALVELVADLHERYDEVVIVSDTAQIVQGALVVAPRPSLEAWLTTDPAALAKTFGIDKPPQPAEARTWLDLQVGRVRSGRGYSAAIDGVELAKVLDPVRLAESSRDFRDLAAHLSPAWSMGKAVKLPRGRPPGVSMFRGTGYTLCLELLRRGEGAELRPADLGESLGRSKTPMRRLVTECVRRGYLRRTTARGPLIIRGTPRLVDDLVKDVCARAANRQLQARGIRSPRPVETLILQIQDRAARMGRAFAVTGAFALQDVGGDELAGAPPQVFLSLDGIDAVLAQLGATADERDPQVVLINPYEAGVFHGARTGRPTLVTPWQAVIDLLASDSSRARERGEAARNALGNAR